VGIHRIIQNVINLDDKNNVNLTGYLNNTTQKLRLLYHWIWPPHQQ
jgi:hypothetical protein